MRADRKCRLWLPKLRLRLRSGLIMIYLPSTRQLYKAGRFTLRLFGSKYAATYYGSAALKQPIMVIYYTRVINARSRYT